jgi:hypothetical protein
MGMEVILSPYVAHKERKNIMKYIKVTNKVKEVNRLGLEKLGLSTKRDNDETIGQFGSGIKFAPIAAIRKGMDWAFVGSDSKGDYILKYVIKEDEGIPCVFYDYGDYEKPSSFTAEAGLLSWTNDFQIYREVVANAIDEAKINGLEWSIDIVDVEEIVHIPGEFSVYFTATKEMIEIHRDFDKYFSINRTPVYENGNLKLYKPIDDTFRVYSKGVLVYSDAKAAEQSERTTMYGVFDYEFDNLELNEERTIANSWELGIEIMRGWSRVKDESIIEDILRAMTEVEFGNYYEFDSISVHAFSYGIASTTWQNVFEQLYPKYILIKALDSTINVIKTIESKGYKCYQIDHDGIYDFLSNRGIKAAKDVFGESFKYDYSMDISNFARLNLAILIINNVLPNVNLENIVGVYEEQDEDLECLGLTLTVNNENSDSEKVILINRDHAENSEVEKLISTLVHEWDHFSTGIGDGNIEGRMFRDEADKKIGYLIYELWKTKIGN